MFKRFIGIKLTCCISVAIISILNLQISSASTQPSSATQEMLPDLVIESVSITPPNPGAGDVVDIQIVIKNQGSANVSGFNAYLYILDANELPDEQPGEETAITVPTMFGLPLAPGQVFKWGITDREIPFDDPQFFVWVDPPWENLIAEENEENNLWPSLGDPGVGGPDAYEDDDACAVAKPIATDGTPQQHNLYRTNPTDSADEDWVAFDVEAGVTYFGTLLADDTVPNSADADITFELAHRCSAPPTFGTGSVFEITAIADGTYYLRIYPLEDDYGPANNYQLTISSDAGCTNHFEPNDSCRISGDIAIGAAPQTHNFCRPGDADWIHFEVKAGASYRVSTSSDGADAQVKLNLFESCANPNGSLTGQTLEFTASEAGFTYIKAENQDAQVHGANTDYTIQVEAVNNESCPEDLFEQDDTLTNASIYAGLGTTQSHNTCPANDVDWIQFNADAGANYALETFNLAAEADTVLCLYTQANERIACDDDNGTGEGSRLIWQAPTSGPYYIQIYHYSTTVGGEETAYDFHILHSLCVMDSLEPDDLSNQASAISLDGIPTSQNFCGQGDADWRRFTAPTTANYLIEAVNLGGEADTVVELYDDAGELLAVNDDYSLGIGSQIAYQLQAGRTYAIQVRPYNPTRFGKGTEYSLNIEIGDAAPPLPTPSPTPAPTQVPPMTPTPENAPPQSGGVQTLILVNRSRLAALHGEGETSNLLNKLDQLASHAAVQGQVVRLDNNAAISLAYDNWVADITSVDKANAVSVAIRAAVVAFQSQHPALEYIVLVGDDRALPFRRVGDNTTLFAENTYRHSDPDHPTGAAQASNYLLVDDYYGDLQPTIYEQREIYIPDLSIGRLVETPAEMISQIDTFLNNPVLVATDVLISGYDFVEDMGAAICALWQEKISPNRVDCDLVGQTWSAQDLLARQTQTAPTYTIQSFSGHAFHYAQGAPTGDIISAHQVADASVDFGGGLVYSPGCHAGLNVPPSNSTQPTDLTQAFTRRGANYVANTGYGWGLRRGIGLSEELLRLFTEELLSESHGSMGQALSAAKQRYYQEQMYLSQDNENAAYHEKILQILTYYGLPMSQVTAGATLGVADEQFPGVDVNIRRSLAGDEVTVSNVSIDFSKAMQADGLLKSHLTDEGSYYTFGDFSYTPLGEPIQPLHFSDLTEPTDPARSLILRSAEFLVQNDFDPMIATPHNEYTLDQPSQKRAQAPALSSGLSSGFYPDVPVGLQRHDGKTNLITRLGQFDAETNQLRLYQNVNMELYHSLSLDQMPPQVTIVDALVPVDLDKVFVKVGVEDESGVDKVIISYVDGELATSGRIRSVDLAYNPSTYKWAGDFPGDVSTRYFVQVVDSAGNVTTSTNKGRYFAPAETDSLVTPQLTPNDSCANLCQFLPFISR